ncbi:MAG: gamma-glutamyltransferase family protein [Geminicoccaceae bacterium]|nr:MAG: gamma-glutamyltransferase family protein [Geminicoccaceae bacterium]
MVATSHSLATVTGLDVLRSGGNAVDAAVAAASMLAVVEPAMTGIGGDLFALVAHKGSTPVAINASGAAPAAADPDALLARGLDGIPKASPDAVTVPTGVAGWAALVEAYGSRSLGELLQPAIRAARDGFRVTPRVAWDWGRQAEALRLQPETARMYLRDGHAPQMGERHAFPQLAATLEVLAKDGVEAFYRGPLAASMVRRLRDLGGVHALDDFAAAEAEWVAPIATDYQGLTVYECPPNGQGIVALLMLNMIADDAVAVTSPDWPHLLAEVTRLAYRERDLVVADPRIAGKAEVDLLDRGHAAALRRHIAMDRAMGALPERLLPPHKDTIYLTVVDDQGTAVSFINSIYDAFGSTLACPETGVLFHNRGRAFRLTPGHPNRLAPHKRPMHTIIPALAYRDDKPWMSFGVMGGDYQCTGQVQLLKAVAQDGLDPQAALELPRSFAYPGALQVETSVPEKTVIELRRRGHSVEVAALPLGGGQAILIDQAAGLLIGGTDPRKDGLALGY